MKKKKKLKKKSESFPGSAVINHIDGVDFNTEYKFLLELLNKPKREIEAIDLAGPALRAWTLFIRGQRIEKAIKLEIKEIESELLASILKLTGGSKASKPTDKQIKSLFIADPRIIGLMMKANEMGDIKEQCQGLADAFGIKKKFRYKRDDE